MTIETSKYTEDWLEREFVGYGYDQPNPQWPGGAKVCVSFVVQYYMGAEINPLEGDSQACNDYLELLPKTAPPPGRNEASEMMYEFGGREGMPRLLTLFDKYKLPVTWNVYTRALEKAPFWIKPMMETGEISLGGHRFKDHFYVPAAEEDALINKSIDLLHELTGDKSLPHGWMVERRSNLSVKLYSHAMAERKLPLQYSSDSCADDVPFWVPSPTSPDKQDGLLMIPFSYDCSDLRFKMRGSGFTSPRDYFLHLKDTFDCLYEEGEAGEGKMMTVLLHPHIIGRPNRTLWLEEFIKYINQKGGVWIARREDIAQHWATTFPYDPKTAFGQTPQPPCGQDHIPPRKAS